MLEINKIHLGDCLELMKDIEDKSVDCIICDLPYNTTECEWDCLIPFEKLWNEYHRIIKNSSPIVLFGSEPFSSLLRCSNLKEFKYDWIWEKNRPTGHLEAKNKPMKKHEIISIFGIGACSNGCNIRLNYNPQNLIQINKSYRNSTDTDIYGKRKSRPEGSYGIQEFTNYPTTILNFSTDNDKIHPTQKPVALLEYLIKTYSNEGDLILDNCSGSGSLAVAAYNTHRNFICIEKNEEYYNKSVERLERVRSQLRLF